MRSTVQKLDRMKKRKMPFFFRFFSARTIEKIFGKYFFYCSREEETEKEGTLFKFSSQIFLVIIDNNFRSLLYKAERIGDRKAYRGRDRQPEKVFVYHIQWLLKF